MPDHRLVGRILVLSFACAALVQAQAPSFGFVRDQIPAEAGPVLGLADFDQDGDRDLLTNYTGIYLNDGHGYFTPHPVLSAISAGDGAQISGFGEPVAIGDLDGDGDQDVISYDAASMTNVGVRKWTNLGNGAFTSSPATPPGALAFAYGYPIRAIALGDVDGDGDGDLVFSFMYPPMCGIGGVSYVPLMLWLNDGAGTFVDASAQLPAQPTTPSQIALVDLDNDGDRDLVCGGESWGTGFAPLGPQIFLNGGAGVFSQTPISLATPWNYDAFSIGDVDGDGFKDLVLSGSPRPSDCVAVGAPFIARNTGAGGFTLFPAPAAGTARCVTQLLDADGNGTDDVIVLGYQSSTVHSFTGAALAPSMDSPPATVSLCFLPWGPMSYASHAATGDLDGDGDRDLVMFTAQGNRALFSDSIGHLVAAPASLETPFGWIGPGTDPADVDGDGDLDLLLGAPTCFVPATGSPTIPVALNDGTGALSSGAGIPCVNCPGSILGTPRAILDVDLDGDSDICVASTAALTPQTSTVLAHVLINSGGAFSLAQTLTLGTVTSYPYAAAAEAADLDGDGDADVVIAGTTSAVLLNDGTGTLQVATTLAAGPGELAVVDVDGDADLDVVIGGSPCKIFLNSGAAGFVQSAGIPAINAYSVAAADFDGDGDQDLLLNNARLNNDGSGGFTTVPGLPSLGTYAGLYAAFDVDLDGFADVVNSKGFLYRNLGGSFGPALTLPLPLLYPIVHADFDRDGNEDLLAGGPAILTNMTRQLARGKPPRPGRPASLEITGAPNAPWLLFASNGTGNLALPPLGTVLLDVPTAQFVYSGVLSPAGAATISGTVPTGSAWVGVSVSWQAVIYDPQGPRLTGLEITTIASY